MQKASFRIWTQVALAISYEDIKYTTSAFTIIMYYTKNTIWTSFISDHVQVREGWTFLLNETNVPFLKIHSQKFYFYNGNAEMLPNVATRKGSVISTMRIFIWLFSKHGLAWKETTLMAHSLRKKLTHPSYLFSKMWSIIISLNVELKLLIFWKLKAK